MLRPHSPGMSSITVRQEMRDRRGNRMGGADRSRSFVFTAGDVIVLVVINAALVVAMWVRHGGLNQLGSPSAKLTAAGQLTALVGTYRALVPGPLMSRLPRLDRRLG